MSNGAVAPFNVVGWDPAPYGDGAGPPHLSRVTVKKTFTGALEAESVAELLTCSADPKDYAAGAGYVASEVVSGVLDGRKGSFVMQHWGIISGGKEKTGGHIVPGSGSGELKGLAGSVEIARDKTGGHSITIIYEID